VNRCFESGVEVLDLGPVTGWGALPDAVQNVLHFGSAALVLGMLAYFCLALFPIGPRLKGQDGQVRFYRVCGWIIVAALVLIGIVKLVLPDGIVEGFDRRNITFWFETIAVFAFATAWLVKGKPLKHPLGLNAPQPQV
jgi:hypothetical protein